MTYEEKRLRLQISQLLANADLNRKTINNIVEEVVKNKLNSECSSGDYVMEQANKLLKEMNEYTGIIEGISITKSRIKSGFGSGKGT